MGIFGKFELGIKVLVSQDCRENGAATGKIGVYEGDFPISVALTNDGGETWSGEYDYDAFVASTHVKEWPLWEGGPHHGDKFAMISRNPRIRLEDGSVIWGYECWWGPVIEGLTLEQAQEATERTKAALRDAISAAMST